MWIVNCYNFNFLKRSIIPLRDSLYSIKSIKDDYVFNAIAHENFSFFSRLHQKSFELLDQIDDDMIGTAADDCASVGVSGSEDNTFEVNGSISTGKSKLQNLNDFK